MVGKVIDFKKQKKELANKIPMDLDGWMKRACDLFDKSNSLGDSKKEIEVANVEKLKKRIEARIAKEIIQTKNINTGMFHCGLYVSKLLSKFISDNPGNWYLIDYLEKYDKTKNPFILQEAGDICFLGCSVFFKKDKATYYKTAGAGLYYSFYEKTEKEIGILMSRNFETIANITNNCLQRFEV